MSPRTVQLVLHYDGTDFAGWQRQPHVRTVQGELEEALGRICNTPTAALGAGRTDAGVHARGQAAGIIVPDKWEPAALRRALNAVLPSDIWVAAAHEMRPGFHARYQATGRRYRYLVGTDEAVRSPFRRRFELAWERAPPDLLLLDECARRIAGEHRFLAFAVKGTAPASDTHVCSVTHAAWTTREGGLVFEITANRFLHHMVRFLVGTMLDIATGRRPLLDLDMLLQATDNTDVSAPAPAHALFLEAVMYPPGLYAAMSDQTGALDRAAAATPADCT